MDRQLVEEVTRMVVERMGEKKPEARARLWIHNDKAPSYKAVGQEREEEEVGGKAKLSPFPKTEKSPSSRTEETEEDSGDLKELIKKTSARIGVGRAGVRPKTKTWLKFRYDHAAAVDAVFGQVDGSLLETLDLFTVRTKVTDQDTYIRRPDYGRRLSEEGEEKVRDACRKRPSVQIIVSDGLSSKAVDENLEDVYLSLNQSLEALGIETGTPFYIDKGRVAVMDHVGEILEPDVVCLLVGERPGLVSAESMSAYLCYRPRIGTIESERQVVSNIHRGGTPPVEAGAYLGSVIEKILDYGASGVELVKKEG
ncbi:ethanolamine ammonia-lyase subunit EutC [Salimicrobium album]|nr:ethanolamine ammonia-lyase subunit EutC [Salimicrobium album]